MYWVVGYYVMVNVYLFILMHVDKKRAVEKKWRIREGTLYAVALLGGALGGLTAMFAFRHKNRKIMFHVVYFGGLMLHAIIIWYISGRFQLIGV